MKARINGLILGALALSTGSVAASANLADEPVNGAVVEIDARYVFAPKGFDDNDEAVVMLDGYLPSGCYRLVRPQVTIDRATKVIKVTPEARFFDVPCVEALIPYSVEVHLGVLPVGEYTVVAHAASASDSMPVAEATNAGPDDYLYAAVDAVAVVKNDATGALSAELKGRFTSSCMTWDEVRVEDTGKTINLLPIISMSSDECVPGEFPFKKAVDLPATIAPGRHLLHVRSLNGRAINYLFSVPAR
jgi:hypothetical protein